MEFELLAAVEGANHGQVDQAAITAGQSLTTPARAPAVLGDQALEVAAEVVVLRLLHRSVDILGANHIATNPQALLEKALAHSLSVQIAFVFRYYLFDNSSLPWEYPSAVAEIAQTADQALAVLLKLSESGAMRPAELARSLDLNRTVVHRLLSTLHARGFVTLTDAGYVPGAILVRLAEQVQPELRAAAAGIMGQVADKVGETVVMHVIDGNEAVVIQQHVVTEHVLRVQHQIGSRHVLWKGASGRALLAYLPEASLDRILRSAPKGEEVGPELALIREQGFALSHDELQHGVYGLAVPVFEPEGQVLASLAVLAPVARSGGLIDHREALSNAAKQISEAVSGELRAMNGGSAAGTTP